ncbi:hypothetical protein [Neisseria montereyensis]|uniref:Uncharacterized protein n=1 Tax=Neisseria montereyensis TaxID=2973938 RepID=A0ABT2FDQ9_9NEIS|nr:hypothetical protein [Neisseria montereyensis]MCS4534265.1 hypothetical protein [Neisseria montereyensis]
MDYQDFEWVDFDKCIGFCEKYDIRPSAYWFLDKKPKAAETLKEFLETLTIPEIKKMAKQKSIAKLPTRKAEIIEKICAEADLQDFKTDINAVLEEREEKYRQARFIAKCETLVHDIAARASSNGLIERNDKRSLSFNYSIYIQNEDEREMAYLMMGGYHTAEDGKGGLKSLPPFFPGDSAWVSAEWDRSKKLEITSPITPTIPVEPTAHKGKLKAQILADQPLESPHKVAKTNMKMSALPYLKWAGIGFVTWVLFAVLKEASISNQIRVAFFAIIFLAPFVVLWIFLNKR